MSEFPTMKIIQHRCLLNTRISHATLASWGAVKTTLVRPNLGQKGPDVKIGGGTQRRRKAANIGRRGRVCF